MLLIVWLVRLIPWIQMCQKSVLSYCKMPRRVESYISMDLQAINIYLTALSLPMNDVEDYVIHTVVTMIIVY